MLIDVKTLKFPLPLHLGSVNCYLIHTEDGYVLVDTGGSNNRRDLLRQLRQAGCEPGTLKIILLTHGDFDHIGNAAFLRSAYESDLALHNDDLGMAERGDMFVNRIKPNILIRTLLPLVSGFGESERFTPDVIMDEGFDLSPYGLHAKIIHIPGHSLGSVGVLTSRGEFFCGDLFENTKGPRFNSIMDDQTAAKASLVKLQALTIGTVYPGHGQSFAMEELLD